MLCAAFAITLASSGIPEESGVQCFPGYGFRGIEECYSDTTFWDPDTGKTHVAWYCQDKPYMAGKGSTAKEEVEEIPDEEFFAEQEFSQEEQQTFERTAQTVSSGSTQSFGGFTSSFGSGDLYESTNVYNIEETDIHHVVNKTFNFVTEECDCNLGEKEHPEPVPLPAAVLFLLSALGFMKFLKGDRFGNWLFFNRKYSG